MPVLRGTPPSHPSAAPIALRGATPPSLRAAGRMGRQVVARRSRRALSAVVRTGGNQMARIDGNPHGHAALLLSVYVLIPFLFDPKWAEDLDASFELRVTDPAGGDPDVSTVVVREGRCEVVPRPEPSAPVTVTIGADDIVRMSSGVIGWPQLVSSGRMVLWGDPYLAMRFPLLFGLPSSRGEPGLLRLTRVLRLRRRSRRRS